MTTIGTVPGRNVPGQFCALWRSRARRLAEMALTPHDPDDFLDLVAPLRAGAPLRARIVEIQPETRDAATIVLQPGRDWAGHVPGQYIRIGIDVDGVRHWRAYSLTHGPRRDRRISITVKAVEGGVVSPFLVHRTKPGTMVHLEQAAGEFVLDESHRRLLFVTAGSGITPVIGMLRNLFPVTDEGVVAFGDLLPRSSSTTAQARRGHSLGRLRPHTDLDVTVVHLAPSHPDSIFVRNLEELGTSGAINLITHYDDEAGFFDVDQLAALVPDLAERVTYACGPGPLLDALRTHHNERGLELQVEQFRVSTITPSEGGSVAIAGRVVDVPAGTTILDAAEAAGVLMPSGCRMGICMGCVLPMTEGAVRDLRTGTIVEARPGETAENGVSVQTCINGAAGACAMTARN